ncbi:MAG: 4-oxalomesaconate tautomerase [Alphaproteobacteria bacterium]|nr:MAG: 4-oxalomesaconate tautomerase [Alphaproteobacteria bacterium]
MGIAVPCTMMRGGTSKGLFFDAADLPADAATRDRWLMSAMGSPDERQIDGMGGAHPLTSKVAVLSRPSDDAVDIDYLFLQVPVNGGKVGTAQTCGNLLAAVGPWAIEQGWVAPRAGITPVRVRLVNTGAIAVVHVETPDGQVRYDGDARIDGVPGTAAPILLDFQDVAGSSCGALLPTGNVRDTVDGIDVTCIDNGMPVVLMRASDFGKTGQESPAALEADPTLKARVEKIRLAIGPRMHLGDVRDSTVPKMCLLSAAANGGFIATRTFIPHRVHEAIGVLGALSVATGCLLPGSVAAELVGPVDASEGLRMDIEHPTGFFTVDMKATVTDGVLSLDRAALLRTARKQMAGSVFLHDWVAS